MALDNGLCCMFVTEVIPSAAIVVAHNCQYLQTDQDAGQVGQLGFPTTPLGAPNHQGRKERQHGGRTEDKELHVNKRMVDFIHQPHKGQLQRCHQQRHQPG